MKRIIVILGICSFFIFFGVSLLKSHCEIPCGIYNDSLRIELIKEHSKTIKKSMEQIEILSKKNNKNSTDFNQITRWILNKEEHSNKIQQIVTQYFMTQRIKPDQEKYPKKLQLLHKILINAMKCKQTSNIEFVKNIKELTISFWKIYNKK